MKAEDLYQEYKCPRCGKAVLRLASFCPHCGHVKEESWWDKIQDFFQSTRTPEASRPTSKKVFSTLLGLLIAGFFFYQALQKGSIQSGFVALISFAMAVRAWFSTRDRVEEASTDRVTTVEDLDKDEEDGSLPAPQRFFCENCNTEVPADASICPKCGTRFG